MASQSVRVRLLRAPPAAGKTQYCIHRIQDVGRTHPLAPIWVVLPNTAQAIAFRSRLAQAGGAVGVWLGTFYDLYAELLTAAGQSVARLEEAVIYRVLRGIVDELQAAGVLRYYAPIHDKPGFIRALRNMIEELKQARATSQQFLDAVADAGPRLEELAAIYLRYQSWLYASEWADAEGQGWLAALALADHPTLASEWQLLVVDGFDEFNPTQLEVLRLLAGRVHQTLVTVTGGGPSRRLALRRFDRACTAVEQALGVRAEPLPGALVHLPAAIRYIEQNLFEVSDAEPPPAGDGMTLVEAQNRTAEARSALRWIKARLVYDRFAPHEVALIARDLEAYRPHLEEAAAEFQVPLNLAQGGMLITNPAVSALLDLLSLPLQNWPRRLVVEAWQSPYFDWSGQGIQPGDAERLDALARYGQVVAGLDQWGDVLDQLVRVQASGVEGEIEADEGPSARVPVGDVAMDLRDKFHAFVVRVSPPQQASLSEYVAWVNALMGSDLGAMRNADDRAPGDASESSTVGSADKSLQVLQRIRYGRRGHALPTAQRDGAALQAFQTLMRSLVFAEAALEQGRSVSYPMFWRELRSGVEVSVYQVPPPVGVDTVLATSALGARGLTFRAVALMGLAEGEFPRASREDPLLRETDRAALRAPSDQSRPVVALASRLIGDEVTIFYQAVTRASERLFVSRPYLTDSGEAWEPSPYWEQLRRLTDAMPIRVRSSEPESPAEAASWPELMTAVSRDLGRPQDPAAVRDYAGHLAGDGRWQRIQAGARVLAARLAKAADGRWEGNLALLRHRLAQDYHPDRPWSASRLETYGTCAFAFFTAYSLHLEPRDPPQLGYDVRQLGSMYHEILEIVFRRASETDADPAKLLPEVAREIFDAAPDQYGFRPTPLWKQQRQELERILAETIEALGEASDGWRPAYFEAPFGLHAAPPLVLYDGEGHTIRLRGYIDRVDVDQAGRLRIVDYKAGSTPIVARDLVAGKRVQLPLYALAAQEALGLGEPAAGMYWHIGSAQPSSLQLERYEGGVGAAIQLAMKHALSHAAGARDGRFAPAPPGGGCPKWCPAIAFCWRYKPPHW